MKTRTEVLFSMALLVGLILITWSVRADVTEGPVEGEFVYAGTGAPASNWTDDQGIMHIWGIPYELTATSGDVEIKITGVCNHNRDPETGDGNIWGDDEVIEVTWGARTGIFRGRHRGTSINWRGYVAHISQGIGGDFVGMELRLDAVYFYTEKRGVFEATIRAPSEGYDKVFFMSLAPGLNMISVPLEPLIPYNARSLAEEIGATVVIKYDEELGKFVGFDPNGPGNGFPIGGGKGYIVNVPDGGAVAFIGKAWTNGLPMELAPPIAQRDSAWASVVSGYVNISASGDDYTVTVKNMQTGDTVTEAIGTDGYFAAAWADLNRKVVIKTGGIIEIAVTDSDDNTVLGSYVHQVTLDEIRNAVVDVQLRLGHAMPQESVLLQNYPNPFNPETWMPFHLSRESVVSIRIYDSVGRLVRNLALGNRSEGIYVDKSKAAYWDGRNDSGEEVASGIYYYSITAGDFSATRKMIVKK